MAALSYIPSTARRCRAILDVASCNENESANIGTGEFTFMAGVFIFCAQVTPIVKQQHNSGRNVDNRGKNDGVGLKKDCRRDGIISRVRIQCKR
jgi:hypothetical protein